MSRTAVTNSGDLLTCIFYASVLDARPFANLWRCWHHHRWPKPPPQKLGPLAGCTNTASKWCIRRPVGSEENTPTDNKRAMSWCFNIRCMTVWPSSCWMSLAAILRAIPAHRRFSSPIFLFLLQRTPLRNRPQWRICCTAKRSRSHGAFCEARQNGPKSDFFWGGMWKIPWHG